MNGVILKDCKFLFQSAEQISTGTSVFVAGDTIKAVGDFSGLAVIAPEAEIVDCSNKIVMPGFVDAHNHLCNTHMNLCRAFPFDYGSILEHMMTTIHGPYGWHNEASMYDISMASLVNAVKHGATTVSNCTILPEVAHDAMRESKVRGILAPQIQTGVRLHNDNLTWQGALDKAEYCLKTYHKPEETMKVVVHCHDLYDCADGFLRSAHALAKQYHTNFVTHFWEFASTVEKAEKAWKQDGGAFAHYLKLGIVDGKTVLFHGSQLDAGQIETLAKLGAAVIHNPDINASNCGTCAYVPKMLEAGLTVGLGSDYGSLSILSAIKLMSCVHSIQFQRELRTIPYEAPFHCATMGGAKAYQLDHLIGSIEPGKRGDIITFDLSRASNLLPMSTAILDHAPLLLHFLFSRNAVGISTCESLINGEFVRKNGEFVHLDEEAIVARAGEWCGRSFLDIKKAREEGRYYARQVHLDYIPDDQIPPEVFT